LSKEAFYSFSEFKEFSACKKHFDGEVCVGFERGVLDLEQALELFENL